MKYMTPLQFTLTTPLKHLQDIYNFLYEKKDNYSIKKILVAGENDPKEHFHVILVYDKEIEEAWQTQKAIVKYLVDKYNLRKSQKGGKLLYTNGRKKGTIKDIDNAITYALKQKLEHKFYGFTDEYIQHRQEQSFIKEESEKIDYIKLLKDKILSIWEEKSYNYINTWSFEPENKGCIYVGSSKKWALDYANVIKKFVFTELLKEDKPIKSQSMVKTIALYLTQYSTNNTIDNYRYEIFMAI